MIVAAIQGGLGNQMFQYACAKQLAMRNEVELKLDLSFYDQITPAHVDPRQFELGIFNLKVQKATDRDLQFFFPGKSSNSLTRAFNRVRRSYLRCAIIREDPLLVPSPFNQKMKHIYLKGYWQSDNFFSEITDVIQNDFTFRDIPNKLNADLLNRIAVVNSIAVHIRRGDYIKNPIHGTLPVTYYSQAIKYINERVENPVYYFFSDDPDWVKDNIRLENEAVYVTHNSGVQSHEDLRLMKSCKHNIIANSSFSWWGGWLNRNQSKIVIAPVTWFRDSLRNVESNYMIPEKWIRL